LCLSQFSSTQAEGLCFVLTVRSAAQDLNLDLLHYYEGSDFCQLSLQSADIPAYLTLPSNHSISKHTLLFSHRFSCHASVIDGFQAQNETVGSPQQDTETSSSSYGLIVRFQLLSTPPRGDAVTFSYGVYGSLRHGLSPC